MEHNFYITVSSGASKNYYPENTSSSFKNHLSLPVKQGYEVGLSQLFYFDNFEPSMPHPRPHTPPPLEVKSFFDASTKNATVKISQEKHIWKLDFFKQTNQHVTSFISQVNEKLIYYKTTKFSIVIDMRLVNGIVTPVLEFKDESKKLLIRLSPMLVKVFGLSQEVFEAGEYYSTGSLVSVDLVEAYQTLSIETPTEINLYKKLSFDIVLNEPSLYNIDNFTDTVILGLQKEGLSINFYRVYDNNMKLEMENIKSISFSERVNRILGLNDDYIFSEAETEFIVPNELVSGMENSIPELPEPEEKVEQNLILVLSNIAKPQRFMGQMCEIIKIINRKQVVNNYVEVVLNPVAYTSLKEEDLSHIQIQLVNADFKPLSNNTSYTTAVLHFRRIRF
jgi:hypothetical protein